MGLTAPVRVTDRCQGCGACLLTCPERAIRPLAAWAAQGIGPLDVLGELCTGCGDCLEVCPVDAIEESNPIHRLPAPDGGPATSGRSEERHGSTS